MIDHTLEPISHSNLSLGCQNYCCSCRRIAFHENQPCLADSHGCYRIDIWFLIQYNICHHLLGMENYSLELMTVYHRHMSDCIVQICENWRRNWKQHLKKCFEKTTKILISAQKVWNMKSCNSRSPRAPSTIDFGQCIPVSGHAYSVLAPKSAATFSSIRPWHVLCSTAFSLTATP